MIYNSNYLKLSSMIIRGIALCLSGLLLGGCVSYCFLHVTRIQVDGSVCDKATGMPISGVIISIQSEKILGRNRIETLAITGEDGKIAGETENKWGRRQKALSHWLDHDPKMEATIRIERESYYPETIDVRLDKYPDWKSNVSINLGPVFLTPTSAVHDSMDAGS